MSIFRVMMVKLVLSDNVWNIISAYSPQVGCDEDTKIAFWNELESVIMKVLATQRNVVQGRLIKAWFGMSKFCSTTALRKAIRWKRASEVVFFQLRHGARMGSFVIGEDTQSIPFAKHHVRRCMGMWLSNGLHHLFLWCEAGQCYFVSEECACKFCGCAGVDKYRAGN